MIVVAVCTWDYSRRFSCNGRFYRFLDLRISCIESSAIRGHRTPEMAEAEQEVVLVMNLDGAATLTHRGREAAISAGGAALISCAEPFRLERTASRRINIGVSRATLAPMLANPDAALLAVIPGASEPLRLLTRYVELLIHDSMLLARAAELSQLAVQHVHDLVALALGATREAAEIAAGRGVAPQGCAPSKQTLHRTSQEMSAPPLCRRAIA